MTNRPLTSHTEHERAKIVPGREHPQPHVAYATVRKMLAQRSEHQIAKFRTTCTDCVPNY